MDWQERAACKDQDPSFWYVPDEVPRHSKARTSLEARGLLICAVCPVMARCRTEAEARGENGTWGGATEQQRRDGLPGVEDRKVYLRLMMGQRLELDVIAARLDLSVGAAATAVARERAQMEGPKVFQRLRAGVTPQFEGATRTRGGRRYERCQSCQGMAQVGKGCPCEPGRDRGAPLVSGRPIDAAREGACEADGSTVPVAI